VESEEKVPKKEKGKEGNKGKRSTSQDTATPIRHTNTPSSFNYLGKNYDPIYLPWARGNKEKDKGKDKGKEEGKEKEKIIRLARH